MRKKCTYIGFDGDYTHSDSPLMQLIKTYYINEVEESKASEWLIHSVNIENYSLQKFRKCLMVSAENFEPFDREAFIFARALRLFFRICKRILPIRSPIVKKIEIVGYSIDLFFYRVTKKIKIFNVFKKKPQLMRPNTTKYFESIVNEKIQNAYVISTNSAKGRHVFNLPYFMHTFIDYYTQLNLQKKSKLKKKQHFCCFLVSDGLSIERVRFFQMLSSYKEVHSYGKVLNNKSIPEKILHKYPNAFRSGRMNSTDSVNKINQELFEQYKFVICFENSTASDYVTEKLPNVLLGNSVAIYRGASNVNEFFNKNAFVNSQDFKSLDALVRHIIFLDQNNDVYQKILDASIFPNNVVPERIKNAKQDLTFFLNKITA